MRKLTGTLLTLLCVLGMLAFTTWNVYAGSAGASRTDCPVVAKEFCLWHFGPYGATCDPPPQCNDGYKPQSASGSSFNGVAGGFLNFPQDKNSPPFSRLGRRIENQHETTWRRISSQITSLLMLVCALGGVAYSIRKLLRPVPASRRHTLWASPFPRAIGYACVAVVGVMAGVLVLTQSAWISPRRAHAARKSLPSINAFDSSPSTQPLAANETQFSSAFQIGGNGILQIGGTAMDKQGNTYVAGAFFGSVTFDTKPQATTLTSTEDFDVFVAKYDSSGQPIWARMANGATGLTYTDPQTKFEEHYSLDGALALAVDAQGNAYVGGGFVRSLSFKDASGKTVAMLGDSNPDINFELFVAKYDASGTLAWARGGMSGAVDNTPGEEDLASAVNGITDIVVDKTGNPYVTGTFSGTNFLGRAVTNNGQRDVLLARLDPQTGNPVWATTPGSAGIDAATGLAIDDNANVYLIGDVGATITFPTQTQPTTLTVDDQYGDSFIAKYDRNGQALWAKQLAGDQLIAGEHIAVTGAGELYLTGAFDGDAKFDSISVTDPSGGKGTSGFLVKYDTGGNALWARIFGHYTGENPDGSVSGYRVAIDKAGTPYVLGTFDKEATFGIESPATQRTLTSMGSEDNFIAHYDAAGNYQWVKQLAESNGVNTKVGDKTVPVETVPLRIVYNNTTNTFTVTGDFYGTLALDRLTLNSGMTNIQSYIATLPVTTAQFSADTYTANKTDGAITITVTRTGDISSTASVDYATMDGTATQARDYILASGTLSFGANEKSKSFTVLLTNNNYADGDKQLNLILSNATNGLTLSAPPVAALIIRNPNTAPPTTNPIDDSRTFVRQQYLDFLNREPDTGGFDYWTSLITKCASTDLKCINSQRVTVSAAFFIEQEFQDTGYYVYRFYKGSLGRQPAYGEFVQDRSRVIGGTNLEASKSAFADAWTQRAEFLAKYPATLSSEQFVDALLQTVKQTSTVDLTSQRQTFINQLQATGGTRGQVIRAVIDTQAFQKADYNRAFVLMQYFGYLRRDPDTAGYNFWLDILNNRVANNYRSMVCAFITSAEYQLRFSPVVTRTDQVCGSIGQ